MRFVIDFLYLLTAIAISPVVLYRMARHRRYRVGWANRFGKIARKNAGKKCIWIHAVSVGEVNATRTIIAELEKRFGDFEIVMSTTTDTGFARAKALFGAVHMVFYFPLDFSWIMSRAFDRIRPSVCLLMELEVWPNFIRTAQRLNVPVIVVNGRISDKSFAGYKKIKPIVKNIFEKTSLILAQTQEYAQRFKEVGCAGEKVIVAGSLKYDTAQIADKIDGSDALAAQLGIVDGRLWVAGGTGPGEEKIILDVFAKLKQDERFGDLRLVIVPRKPERFDEVAQLIGQAGFEFVRYSCLKNSEGVRPDKKPAILGDTMGDLRKFYSLASIIFVGRSLVPMGGSDMAEAAALGKCTMFGPYTFNFKQTVDDLLRCQGALEVQDENDLLIAVRRCLAEPDFAGKLAENGQEVIRKKQGATTKTIDQIAKFLNTT